MAHRADSSDPRRHRSGAQTGLAGFGLEAGDRNPGTAGARCNPHRQESGRHVRPGLGEPDRDQGQPGDEISLDHADLSYGAASGAYHRGKSRPVGRPGGNRPEHRLPRASSEWLVATGCCESPGTLERPLSRSHFARPRIITQGHAVQFICCSPPGSWVILAPDERRPSCCRARAARWERESVRTDCVSRRHLSRSIRAPTTEFPVGLPALSGYGGASIWVVVQQPWRVAIITLERGRRGCESA